MTERQRLSLAVVLSLGVLVVWSYLQPPPAPAPAPAGTTGSPSSNEQTPKIGSSSTIGASKMVPQSSGNEQAGKTIATTVDELLIETSGVAGGVRALRLELAPLNRHQQPEIIDFSEQMGIKSLGGWTDGLEPVPGNWSLEGQDLVFEGRSSTLQVKARYQRQKRYHWRVTTEVRFLSDTTSFAFQNLGFNYRPPTTGGMFSPPSDQINAEWLAGTNHKMFSSESDFRERVESKEGVDWVGVSTKYFLVGLVSDQTQPKNIARLRMGNSDSERLVELGWKRSAPTMVLNQELYIGPKVRGYLTSTHPSLFASIDFGFFGTIAALLLKVINFFHNIVGNYGWSIVLTTLVVKAILFPFAWKSMASMRKMSLLQPQLAAVREKFKGNPQQLNQETMKIMKDNKANPLGGCLLALVQLPVFMALYQVLSHAIELYRAPFMFWISDLSVKDHFFVLPVLMTILMWVQQKLTPMTGMDPAQQKIMNMMPLIFGAMMLTLPSGLALYMTVNSVVSIIQQKAFYIKYPLPSPGVVTPVVVEGVVSKESKKTKA